MLVCQISALAFWPVEATAKPRKGTFTVNYPRVLNDLDAELRALKATDIVLQMYVPETKVRSVARSTDGWPKADSKTIKPGVVLNFEGRYGAQQFACDTDGED